MQPASVRHSNAETRRDLRMCLFCSEDFRNSATEAEVLNWLGDRDSQMIHIYRHLRQDDSKRKMNEIDFVGGGALPSPRLLPVRGDADDQHQAG